MTNTLRFGLAEVDPDMRFMFLIAISIVEPLQPYLGESGVLRSNPRVRTIETFVSLLFFSCRRALFVVMY